MSDQHYFHEPFSFVWDEEKNRSNVKKHGVDFKTAALVFHDDLRLEYPDPDHSEEEARYRTIGLVHDVLTVVYCDRENGNEVGTQRIQQQYHRQILRIGGKRMGKDIRYILERDRRLTEEEIAMIEAARELPEVYDADNPPIDPVETPEQYAALMRAVGERNRRIAGRRAGSA